MQSGLRSFNQRRQIHEIITCHPIFSMNSFNEQLPKVVGCRYTHIYYEMPLCHQLSAWWFTYNRCQIMHLTLTRNSWHANTVIKLNHFLI